jgi:hypothetical protein
MTNTHHESSTWISMRKSELMRTNCLSLLQDGACSAIQEKGNGVSGRVATKSSGRRFQVSLKATGTLGASFTRTFKA